MLDTPNNGTHRGVPASPISARSLLPLTWSLVSELPSSIVVSVSIPTENGNALMTSEVEVIRDSWEAGAVEGPDVHETDLAILCADVERWANGSRCIAGGAVVSLDGYDAWKTSGAPDPGDVPDEHESDCSCDVRELLSLDGRTLDDAVRVCIDCGAVDRLTDRQVEGIRVAAEKLVKAGWEQHTDILVACEDALLGGPTSRAAREQVAKLLADKAVR